MCRSEVANNGNGTVLFYSSVYPGETQPYRLADGKRYSLSTMEMKNGGDEKRNRCYGNDLSVLLQ